MRIVVVSAHPDDFIYGTGGTLITHHTDDRHLIVLAPIQRGPMTEVAEELGLTLHVLDGTYKHIDQSSIASLARRQICWVSSCPTTCSPRASKGWSPDHTAADRSPLGPSSTVARTASGTGGCCGIPSLPPRRASRRIRGSGRRPRPARPKLRLATVMVRGAENVWPARGRFAGRSNSGHQFAHQVGWPAAHVEAFDALYAVPFDRLPPPDASTAHLVDHASGGRGVDDRGHRPEYVEPGLTSMRSGVLPEWTGVLCPPRAGRGDDRGPSSWLHGDRRFGVRRSARRRQPGVPRSARSRMRAAAADVGLEVSAA